jgi:hypothetical protein
MPIYQDQGGGATLDSIQTISSATSATGTAWGSTIPATFTAPGQALTLPAINTTDIGKSITVQNAGTFAFTLAIASGTITSAIGLTIAPGSTFVIKAVATTSAIVASTNAAQSISPDTGTAYLTTNTSIPNTANSPTSAILMPGMLFAALESAKYHVSIRVHSNQTAANQFVVAGLYDTLTPSVPVTGSQTLISNPGATGEYSGASTFEINATAGRTYQVGGYNTSAIATAAFISGATTGLCSITWQKVGGVAASSIAGATAGDIKFSGLATDHGGSWILLDGRLKSTLAPAQQAVATTLGYGANIPDMRGRVPVGVGGTLGAALNTIGGSLAIPQNALPNVTLSVSGSATLGGSGIWWYNGTAGNARMPNGGGVFDAQSTTSLTVGGNTASINGGVAQQNFISPYFANNWFVWLGSSVSTLTLSSPMVGANGTIAGTGGTVPNPAATDNTKFLRGDGTWAVPALPLIQNTGIGTQALGSAAWQLVAGGSITVPSAGIWQVEYALSWSNPAANTMYSRMTNAAGVHQPRSAASSYGLNSTNRSSFIATYNAGDVIKLEWAHTTGTSTLINNAAGTANIGGETYIQMIKLN